MHLTVARQIIVYARTETCACVYVLIWQLQAVASAHSPVSSHVGSMVVSVNIAPVLRNTNICCWRRQHIYTLILSHKFL
jgi:hypothetical protein